MREVTIKDLGWFRYIAARMILQRPELYSTAVLKIARQVGIPKRKWWQVLGLTATKRT